MSTTTPPESPPDAPQTVGELIARLGDVPPERIRLVPTPGTATEADLLEHIERRDILCELVDGTLVEKTVGWRESALAMMLGHILLRFMEDHDVDGRVSGPDGPHRTRPGRSRLSDVSFTAAERLPDSGERGPIADWAPDLGVGILSASNGPGEMSRKLEEYFAAGVRLVWYVDPATRTVRVHTSPDDVVELGEDDTLDGGDVLPGFELSIRKLFDSVK